MFAVAVGIGGVCGSGGGDNCVDGLVGCICWMRDCLCSLLV